MKVDVIVFEAALVGQKEIRIRYCDVFRTYTMDNDDPSQRRVLGEQCRNAFEAGQCVLTYPVVP